MNLDLGLSMTEEMRAEMKARIDAKAGRQARAALRAQMLELRLLVTARADLVELKLDEVREAARRLPRPFRRKVDAALDVIRGRGQGLAELAIDAAVVELTPRTIFRGVTEVRMSPHSEDPATLQRAGDRLVGAVQEIRERVTLEVLRHDEDADLSWSRRRSARREAARCLTEELRLFLDAIEELPEVAMVELAAEELLSTRREADIVAGLEPDRATAAR